MTDLSPIRYLALDADDTLWMNEPIFVKTQDACRDIADDYISDPKELDEKLYEYEKKNLRLFGYGDQRLCAFYDRDGHRTEQW